MAPIYTFSSETLLSKNPLKDLKIIQLTCWFDCLALTSDGKVFRHQTNSRKWVQVSFPSTMIHPDTHSEIPVNIIQIEETGAFGMETYFALTSEGFVFSWGFNNSAIRGHSFEFLEVSTPAIIPSLRNITFITAGSFINQDHSSSMALAINSTGHMFTWGSNEEGCLGLGISDTSVTNIVPYPQLLPLDYDQTGPFVKADAIALHVVAWSQKGQIFTWGFESSSQQTTNGQGSQNSPFNMTEYFYQGAKAETLPIDSLALKECSVATEATACLFGGYILSYGAMPIRGTSRDEVISVVPLPSNVTNFKLLREGGIAILDNHQVYVWGDNYQAKGCFDDYYHLQYPQPLSKNPPNPYKPFLNNSDTENKQQLSNVIIQSGLHCNYLLITKPNMTKSALHVWGKCPSNLNLDAQANQDLVKEPSNDQMYYFNLSDIMIYISYKHKHALTLTSNGTVIGWGENNNNQLGVPSVSSPLTPFQLLQELSIEDRKAKQISAGVDFSLILLNNGSLIGAGNNERGNLASEVTSVSQFTLINTTFLQEGESIVDIEACKDVSFVATSSGKVYGTGSNEEFKLLNDLRLIIPYFIPLRGGIIDKKRIIKVVCYHFAVLLSDDGEAIAFKDGTSKKLELPDPTDSVIDMSVYAASDVNNDGVQNIHLLTRKGNVYGNGSNQWFEMSATLENFEATTPTLTISSKNILDGIPYSIGTGLNNAIVAVAKEWTCFSKNATDDTVCNSSGFCVAPDTCRCKHVNISGIDCGLFKCFGIWKNESNVCSGAGNCTMLDTCQCKEGFGGDDCSIPSCFGKLAIQPEACNGRGFCVAPNKCECKEGYYGPQCENKSCYNFSNFEKELAATRRTSSMKVNLCSKLLNYL